MALASEAGSKSRAKAASGCLPRGKGVPSFIVFMVGDSHSLVYLYLVNAILSSNSFSLDS